NMHATVVGGKGFIGQVLVRYLQALGWGVWVPERDHLWPDSERALGHIFYCAGLTADYLQHPERTVEAHVGLLARVLQSTNFTSLVYLSSTRLYDGLPSGTTAQETALLPVAPHIPRHIYDLTKLTGESLCHVLGQGKARVARLSCVYDTTQQAQGFLPDVLRLVQAAERGDTVTLTSSPHFSRDYIHVNDVVRGLVDMAQSAQQVVYNLASGLNLTNAALATLIEQHSGRKVLFAYESTSAEPATVSIDRLTQEWGWRPRSAESVLTPWLNHLQKRAS
ncbi:MAG: NAD(P)-dependent oxidoreductase, partial [Burkholderiales bacterium]|nr:NAD(P)-dependent oxidoreductase [Burkholderiales bacterium]